MGVTGSIIVIDSVLIRTNNPTLSEVFGDALKHPIKRWPVIVTWGLVTSHLFGEMMPEPLRSKLGPYDPIGYVARKIESA